MEQNQEMTDDKLQKYKKGFEHIDKEGKGEITEKDLKSALKEVG